MTTSLFLLWLALVFFAGLFIGVLLTRFGAKPTWHKALEAQALQDKLDLQTEELNQLKANVGDHFVETAALVNNLTHSYKAVYDHLEKGAYDLVGEEVMHRRLKDVQEEPIMLEYIGQRRKAPEELRDGARVNQLSEGAERAVFKD